MRSVKSMVWEPSLLDSEEGIRYRGLTIPECQQQLTKAPGGAEPLPEALLWLLITGEVPTEAQTRSVSADLAARAKNGVSAHVLETISVLSKNRVHPMNQVCLDRLLSGGGKFLFDLLYSWFRPLALLDATVSLPSSTR